MRPLTKNPKSDAPMNASRKIKTQFKYRGRRVTGTILHVSPSQKTLYLSGGNFNGHHPRTFLKKYIGA